MTEGRRDEGSVWMEEGSDRSIVTSGRVRKTSEEARRKKRGGMMGTGAG